MLYCCAVYSYFGIQAVTMLSEKMPEIFDQNLDLDDRLIAIQIVCQIIPLIFVPVVWIQTNTMTNVALQNVEFEVRLETSHSPPLIA